MLPMYFLYRVCLRRIGWQQLELHRGITLPECTGRRAYSFVARINLPLSGRNINLL